MSENFSQSSALFDNYGLALYQNEGNKNFVARIIDSSEPNIVSTGTSVANVSQKVGGKSLKERVGNPVGFTISVLVFLAGSLPISILINAIIGVTVPLWWLLISQIVVATLFKLFTTVQSPGIRHYFNEKSAAKAELTKGYARKEIEPVDSSARYFEIDHTVGKVVNNFLKVDYHDKRAVVSLLKSKLDLNEDASVLSEWMQTVTSIFELDRKFPVDYIPVLNIPAYKVFATAELQALENKEKAEELALAEEKARDDVMKGFANDASQVAVTGALAYLGVSALDEMSDDEVEMRLHEAKERNAQRELEKALNAEKAQARMDGCSRFDKEKCFCDKCWKKESAFTDDEDDPFLWIQDEEMPF